MSIQFNGKAHTTATFTAIVNRRDRSAATVDEATTSAVALAMLQVAHHNNVDWFKRLMASPSLRTQAGDLNKDGRLVWSYIQSVYKGVDWDDSQNGPVIARVMSKGHDGIEVSKTAGKSRLQYFITGETDQKGKPVKASILAEDFQIPGFQAFRNAEAKAKPAPTTKPVSMKAQAKSLKALADSIESGRELTGSADDYTALQVEIKRLQALITDKGKSIKTDVDPDRVHMSNGMKPGAKAKAAN